MTNNTAYRISIILAIIVAIGLGISGAGTCSSDYYRHIGTALDALETGRTADCVRSIQDAFANNANDPLARVVLGTALVCGRRPADARSEFDKALSANNNCGAAMYGKALAHLSEKKYEYAASAFNQAHAKSPEIDVQSELEYIRAIQSGSYSGSSKAEGDPLGLAMGAMHHMSQKKHSEARAVWERLRVAYETPSYRDRPGCAVTFLRSAPVATVGSELTNYAEIVPPNDPKMPVLSGTVTLRADLSRAQSVKMVLFFIDEQLVGITNLPPFQYPWDTRKVANGHYTLKIQGSDEYGANVSEKSTKVVVRNESSALEVRTASDPEAEKLWSRLWKTLKLKVSTAAINYNIAMCAIESNDNDAAEAALERTLAANPDYVDAGDRLASLYTPMNLPEKLYSVKTDQKVIALTFDDGPKVNTGELLDLLDSKGVKATFFVVGKMAAANPEICRQMVESGHELANHTYNHQALEFISSREITQELFTTAALLRSITGTPCRFMRAPGGRMGERLPVVLKKYGMTNVLWSANCTPYQGKTADEFADYATKSARPGGIILMHNLEGVTLQALPTIIDTLKARGYRFVTISELTSGG